VAGGMGVSSVIVLYRFSVLVCWFNWIDDADTK